MGTQSTGSCPTETTSRGVAQRPYADQVDGLDSRIAEAASHLRSLYSELELRLQQEQEDNANLRAEVAQWRRCNRELSRIDVSTLRRRLAFHLHPDLGGDGRLMGEINAACDCIAHAQANAKQAA